MPSLINLLKDVNVKAISLVSEGANGSEVFLYKCDGFDCATPELGGGRIVKADGDWSAFYIVVAEPGREEKPGLYGDPSTVDVWADEDEIRKAAWRFMKNGALVNQMHEDMEPYGTVVENAVAHADFEVGEHTIRKGSWYVAIEPNEIGRQKIESGEWTGVSIQGTGTRVAKSPAESEKIGEMSNDGWLRRIAKGLGIDVDSCDCGCHEFVASEELAEADGELVEKAALTAAGRKALPKSAFVFPAKAPGSGSYPIHDRAHAANALARSSGKPEYSAVRAAVCKRFSDLPACKKQNVAKGLDGDVGTVASMELSERVENIEKAVEAHTEKIEGIEKSVTPLGEKLDAISKQLDETKPPPDDGNGDGDGDGDGEKKTERKTEDAPTAEELSKKILDLAEGQGVIADSLVSINEQVEKLAEETKRGGSRQVDDPEPVEKSNGHPLAGLFS